MFRNIENELEGFQVFAPNPENSDWDVINLRINRTGMNLSLACLRILGEPEYAVAFLDFSGKRLMIKPAVKETPNRFRLSRNGTTRTSRRNKISVPSLRKAVVKIAGIDISEGYYIVYGHEVKVVQPTLIFDLGNVIRRMDKLEN